MEEENKKGTKSKITTFLLFITLICIICIFILMIFDKGEQNSSQDNKQEDNIDILYSYERKDNGDITFYQNDKIINEYKCNGVDCDILLFDLYDNVDDKNSDRIYFKNSKVLILECDGTTCDYIDDYGGEYFTSNNNKSNTGKVLLYDIVSEETKTYENVHGHLLDDWEKISDVHEYNYVKVLIYNDDTIRIISYDGKLDRTMKKDNYNYSCYEGCFLDDYDYTKNIIVFKNNNKYGLQKLDTGETIIDNIYDELELYSEYGLIGKKDNKYNIYNFNNEQVTKLGYDRLYFINKDILFAYNNKKFSFINLNEEKIIEDTIEVDNIKAYYGPPKLDPSGVTISYQYSEDGQINEDVCDIYIEYVDKENKMLHYTFNTKTFELIKIDDSNEDD